MNSVQVLLLNAVLYTVTLLFFYIRYKFSMGVMIWILYTVSAWSSFLFVQQPGYAGTVHSSEQTILPCLYLYTIFVISMTPLFRINRIEKIDELSFVNSPLLKWIMITCTAIQLMFFIIDLPSMIMVLHSGAYMFSALRSAIYGSDGITLLTQNQGVNRLSLLFSGMRILSTGLSVVTFLSFKEQRLLVDLFAISALLNNVRLIIVQVGRGEMILVLLLYACIFYLMRDWIDEKKRRTLIVVSIPIIVASIIFFWAISISRFGDNARFYIYKYLGEPINNFNGILFKKIRGTTNGRAYFSLLFRYLFGESGVITAKEKWRLIFNATGIRGDIFYTWVGGVIIEFGKTVPFFVAVILNIILNKVANIKYYYAGDILLMIFFINFYTRGIFMFPTQNFEGMLMIFYSVFLYLLFRINKAPNGHIVFRLPLKKR